jgi:hypothetical protein
LLLNKIEVLDIVAFLKAQSQLGSGKNEVNPTSPCSTAVKPRN